MNKDNRISNFTHMRTLISDGLDPFPHQAIINQSGSKDDDVLFVITESGSHNEKLKYKNLKKSILDNSVLLTGNQLISGKKTFADPCTFESTIFINEVIDITQTGDISGNIFVGESGLFEKVGVGLHFTDRRVIKDVYSDFPSDQQDYVEYDFGGGIKPKTFSEKTYNYQILSGDGADYIFSGDATGLDPDLEANIGDTLIFQNQASGHTLSIRDFEGTDVSTELSGINTFTPNSTGLYQYYCTTSGHELMVGNINIINPEEFGGIDFKEDGTPELTTKISSYSIYEPSGYYNSNTPQSQQNYLSDTSLDGHSFEPDEIHREMGGAWIGIDFIQPFNYKGFSIYRNQIENSAEKIKVVASNNGTDWTTIHRLENLTELDYSNEGERSSFSLENYHPEQYSKYRLIAEKIIGNSSWELAHFNFSGVREHSFVKTVNPQYTLHVSGDSSFSGDITQTGFYRQEGDLYRLGNTNQTGDSFVAGNETVTGDLRLGRTLYHFEDEDTYIAYTEDKIDITAGSGVKLILNEAEDNKMQFFTSGEEQMRLDSSGFLGINTTTPFAELCVTGDSYLECLFTTGEDGQWERVFGGSDEVVSFVTALDKGQDSYKINFPKTFGESPTVTLSLENNEGGPIVPYFISGVNNYEYYINFGSNLLNDGYKIHTSVRSTGQSAVNKTTTQSFITELVPSGTQDTYEIFFPNKFHTSPVVSATLESEELIIPYIISGITDTSYKLLLGRELQESCKIHTHAVR